MPVMTQTKMADDDKSQLEGALNTLLQITEKSGNLTHWHTTFYNTWRTYIYIYIGDISSLRVNGPSEPGRLRDVCVCQWVNRFVVFFSGSSTCWTPPLRCICYRIR